MQSAFDLPLKKGRAREKSTAHLIENSAVSFFFSLFYDLQL